MSIRTVSCVKARTVTQSLASAGLGAKPLGALRIFSSSYSCEAAGSLPTFPGESLLRRFSVRLMIREGGLWGSKGPLISG